MVGPVGADAADIIATAQMAADAARVVTLRYFRGSNLNTTSKRTDFDPVTAADREAEQVMRDIITARRPDDAILGEEYGETAGTSGLTWVLDPIDGTRGFISGTPTWGVLIAVRDATRALYGIVDQPYIGERFAGGFGTATFNGPHNSHALVTASNVELSEAIIFTTFPEVGEAADAEGFQALAQHCKLTRYGMDCYAYALLAAGQVDLVVEAGLQTYDILGPLAVIEAAGGIVTDWKGGSAMQGGRVIAAANAEIHARALEILSKY
ncbi:histidinol-phosphatase [Celeribacter marinus]|uniref:Histidinol-phosphatase n=1 Tax=Celeribacter marinus TaxID=1397108 RepID=A0A0P0A9Z3_9RHOB|nr:histidinol-phosphatase [Celeribacter marinus]ALI54919.1 histidinol-phosphatase [Celeribacter marinus]SFK01896.1 histidinol-phosphatase, inositol monophosphatase family [Celeribacter marinus]